MKMTDRLAILLPLAARAVLGQCSGIYLVDQPFPVSGPEETRWRICWQEQARNGLMITSAFFRKSPASPFVRILWDARISEIFVPYHDGSPRYFDVTNFSFSLVPVSNQDCPASGGGATLGSPAHVCREVRDRGLAWKDYGNVRRGQEVSLWAALGAGNYNYVMEWTFRDDGVFMGRVGATAVNLPSKPLMTHVHNPIWRLDIDLDGFPGDSATWVSHSESGPLGADTFSLAAQETGFKWNAEQFNILQISDANLKNSRGDASTYMLMPIPSGMSRHQEAFTANDFWVTRYNSAELNAKDVNVYASNLQPIAGQDIVVWYKGSLHHFPRDEDGEFVDRYWKGEAHVMWTGFMMMPHNLFDRTPLVP